MKTTNTEPKASTPGEMKKFVDIQKIYLYREPVDFRKAIDGLALIVQQDMELSAFEVGIFVFCNKGRDKIKVLYWDKTGFCLWYKRLEKHTFQWPRQHSDDILYLSESQWHALLARFPVMGHQPLDFTTLS